MKKMRVNQKLCAGCRYCEVICSLEHSKLGETNTKKARIHIVKDPKNGEDYPRVCRQCPDPHCVAACPQGALSVSADTGAVIVDEARCTGCLLCAEACPFHAVQVDVETRLPLICDLCGGDPSCIKHCRVLPHVGARALNYAEPGNDNSAVKGDRY